KLNVSDAKSPWEHIKPWIDLAIPNEPALGGKTVKLLVTMHITHPVRARRGGNHPEATTKIEKEVTLQLAEAGNEQVYKQAWQAGCAVGLGGCLLGGFVLTFLGYTMRWNANPPRTFAL